MQFFMQNEYWPNFMQPSTFSEKLWHRMLYDRDPRFTVLCDKLRARDYVAEKIGEDYLTPLLWSGVQGEDIPFEDLPEKFVIKANHGAGYNIIVKDKAQIDEEKAIRQMNSWLRENFGKDKYLSIAWGYKSVKPRIMIEAFIEEGGKVPADYKFWCFSGRVECITVHFDRFKRQKVRTFSRDFEPYKFEFPLEDHTYEYRNPANVRTMVRLAETVTEGFGFMRVDFYNVDGEIFFGEFTVYPGGVSIRFQPPELDTLLGQMWEGK